MTDWKGMNTKSTPVFPDSTLAILAQNQRFKIRGEMQRRPGLAASNLSKLSDAIVSMWCGADYNEYLITQVGGIMYGDRSPEMQWGETVVVPPVIIKGNPSAPVITGVIFTPATGSFNTNVLMTVVYTYNGLAGPLTWSYPSLTDGGGNNINPDFSTSANDTMTYTGFALPPGAYTPPVGPALSCTTTAPIFTSNSYSPSLTVL